jgi:hypothetical protein
MTPEEALDDVKDRESFVAFVHALAAERAEAEEIERQDPKTYVLDGAFNWKNGDIASFLFACLDYFTDKPFHQPEREPNWRMFADFLYCGKIIE